MSPAASRSGTRPRGRRRTPDLRDELLPALTTVVLGGAALGLGTWVTLGRSFPETSILWAAGLVWAVGIVTIGAVMPRPLLAAAAGLVAAGLAATTHHVGGTWFDQVAVDGRILEKTVVAAAVVGPVLGASGYWLRYRADRSRPLTIAAGAAAALTIALIVIGTTVD